MTNPPTFSDEELTAFIDGEFEHTRAEKIQRALENSAEIQTRIKALALNKSQINSAFDLLLYTAPEMPDLPEIKPAKAANITAKSIGLIAAFSFVFLIGGLSAGYFAGQHKDKNWREFVAIYQTLYINATLAGIEQQPKAATLELDKVSQSIGKKVDLSVLVQQSQLDYKRAQILGFEGRPLMQLTFLSKIGDPIALCIIRSGNQESREIVVSEMHGMLAASWSKDGYEYLLIGGHDAALIKSAANGFAKSL